MTGPRSFAFPDVETARDRYAPRVHVNFSCRMGLHESCECNELDNADPNTVGWPPYHEGCACFVIWTIDTEAELKREVGK